MNKKKHIGKFLEKKKSWKKVIGYLKKRLSKSVPWDYTYEFDEGKIRVQIIPITDKGKGKVITQQTADEGGSNTDKTRRRSRRRKKQWQ